MAGIDWISIKNEYINTDTSYRKLAAKYNVSSTGIAKRAKAEDWVAQKEKLLSSRCTRVLQKTSDRLADKEVKRIERISTLVDELIDKLEQAARELDCHTVVNRVSAKRYTTDSTGDRVEITTENKKISYRQGTIKVSEVKQLTSALRDLRELHTTAALSHESEPSKLFLALEEGSNDIS